MTTITYIYACQNCLHPACVMEWTQLQHGPSHQEKGISSQPGKETATAQIRNQIV